MSGTGLRKARRSESKCKIGFSGPSGSGKTYSALRLANGLLGSLEKVVVLDTENGSADLYADLGDYSTMPMHPPFDPRRFVKGIDYLVGEGFECIIIDSATHEWDGKGGCLDIHSNLGGQFSNWKDVTPLHRQFIDAILQAPVHVLTTTRRKQDYIVEQNDKGKMAPKKVGLREVQRDGFEYELTVAFDIETNHLARASKDRTSLFASAMPFMITEETGERLKEWSMGNRVDPLV